MISITISVSFSNAFDERNNICRKSSIRLSCCAFSGNCVLTETTRPCWWICVFRYSWQSLFSWLEFVTCPTSLFVARWECYCITLCCVHCCGLDAVEFALIDWYEQPLNQKNTILFLDITWRVGVSLSTLVPPETKGWEPWWASVVWMRWFLATY